MLKRVTLREFLQRSNAATLAPLPLVHTTQGHRLADILNNSSLTATRCDVFEGENLCYMFVGRPAYKVKESASPQYWELPIAFVTRFSDELSPKRVFPFDSGAFRRGLLSDSITVFPIEEFDISGDNSLIGRFISAFYGSNDGFYRGNSSSVDRMKEEHIIGVNEMGIEATAALHNEKLTDKSDDRAKSIELQFGDDFIIREGELLAIILPEQFKTEPAYVEAIRNISKEARYYDTYPLRTDSYYSQIYNITRKIIEKYSNE